MKKISFTAILVLMAILSLTIQINWNSTSFYDTLQTDPEEITRMKLSLPGNNHYVTIDDSKYIKSFFDYMDKIRHIYESAG